VAQLVSSIRARRFGCLEFTRMSIKDVISVFFQGGAKYEKYKIVVVELLWSIIRPDVSALIISIFYYARVVGLHHYYYLLF